MIWEGMDAAPIIPSGLVRIATIFSRPELACFVASLEAEGIATSIIGDLHGSVDPIVMALGGYHVMVPKEDVEDAITVIREAGFDSPIAIYPPNLRTRIWMAFLVGMAMITVVPLPFAGRSEYARRHGSLIELY